MDGPLVGRDATVIGTYTRQLGKDESGDRLSSQSFYVCKVDLQDVSIGFSWFPRLIGNSINNQGIVFAPINDRSIADAREKAKEEAVEQMKRAESDRQQQSIVQAPRRPQVELGPTTSYNDDSTRYIARDSSKYHRHDYGLCHNLGQLLRPKRSAGKLRSCHDCESRARPDMEVEDSLLR